MSSINDKPHTKIQKVAHFLLGLASFFSMLNITIFLAFICIGTLFCHSCKDIIAQSEKWVNATHMPLMRLLVTIGKVAMDASPFLIGGPGLYAVAKWLYRRGKVVSTVLLTGMRPALWVLLLLHRVVTGSGLGSDAALHLQKQWSDIVFFLAI